MYMFYQIKNNSTFRVHPTHWCDYTPDSWSQSSKYFSQPLMQPIPIVACFGEFLPLLSSSAGEIHVRSDLNLEIDFLRLSMSWPLEIPWLNWQGVLGHCSDAIWSTSPMNLVAFSWILVGKMVLYPYKFILLLPSYIKSSVSSHQLRGPVPETAMHAYSMIPPPSCFTDEAVCLGLFAVPFFLHIFR